MTPFIIEEGNLKGFLEKPVSLEMDKSVAHFENNLATIRTGLTS